MESLEEPNVSLPENYFSQIFTLIISVAIVMTGFGIIFPVFPQLLVKVGGGDAEDLGYMAAFFGFSYLIFSPIFGNLADTIGKKRVILIGLFGFSLSNLVYTHASEVWHFYVARAIEGGFSSAILPPAIALTTQLTPKQVRARYIGYIVAGNTIGLIIGPLIGGVLFDGIVIGGIVLVKGSLFLPFWVSLGIGLSAFTFGIIFLPSADKFEMKYNIDKEEIVEQSKSAIKSSRSVGNFFRHQIEVLPKPLLMFGIFLIADIFTVLPWLVVSPGFIFYFYEELFLSASDFGYFVAAYGLFAATGQALLGNLSDKYGRKPLIFLGQIFAVGFYGLLPLGRTPLHFILIAIFAGISSGLRDPALKALLSDVTSEDTRATAFGIESGLLSISQIAGPIIGGYVYVNYGVSLVFLIALLITIFNVLVVSLLNFNNNSIEVDLSSLKTTNQTISD